jgi:hypothetical protein
LDLPADVVVRGVAQRRLRFRDSATEASSVRFARAWSMVVAASRSMASVDFWA